MSIDDANTIDMVATHGNRKEMRLVISDHLPWDDEHAVKFRSKILYYLDCLSHGRVRLLPDHKVVVWVRCRFAPRKEDLVMLEEFKELLAPHGADLIVESR